MTEVKNGGTFVFATMMGDTLHVASPVYFCEKDCSQGIHLKEIEERQLGILTNEESAIIAEEYNHAAPRVLDGKMG